MLQIHVRFVEDHNLPVLQACAHLPRSLGVVLPRHVEPEQLLVGFWPLGVLFMYPCRVARNPPKANICCQSLKSYGMAVIEKPCYSSMLWGRLAYDPTLTNAHFERVPGEHYNRECVQQTIDEYPDLTGFGITLGERMGGQTLAERRQFLDETFFAGIAAAKRPVKFIYRAPLSANTGSGGSTSEENARLTRAQIGSECYLPANDYITSRCNSRPSLSATWPTSMPGPPTTSTSPPSCEAAWRWPLIARVGTWPSKRPRWHTWSGRSSARVP
jgi:hypothetical protein